MAPHHAGDSHHGKPSPLSVAKNNAVKPTAAGPHKRDLQSAMHNAPQVRVIHIFAPKVIKTDVANFRATVQKLTGRSKRRTPRAAKTAADAGASSEPQPMAAPESGVGQSSMGFSGGFWEKEELQRLMDDTCGVPNPDLVRCDSVDSGNYSLDSGNTVFSGDSSGVDTSPTSDGFSFYPQRETPYSLGEIPAPFFGLQPHDMHSVFNQAATLPMSMPLAGPVGLPPEHALLGSLPTSHLTDQLGFEVDSVGLPLSDVLPLSGSLFDLPRQHCRPRRLQPFHQGANIFESM